MSLVLDALRRVERPEGHAGSVGVAVSSYRPARRRAGFIPLLLGLICGAAIMLLFGPDARAPRKTASIPAPSESTSTVPPLKPPQSAVEPERAAAVAPAKLSSVFASAALPPFKPRALPVRAAPLPQPPAFVLQAISERDHHPIAIVNDQLVKEGDLIGGVRVLKIGAESVDLLLENGTRGVARFAPPPPTDATPIP